MPFDGLLLAGLPPPPTDNDHGGDKRPRRETPLIVPAIQFCERQTREIWRGMFTIRYEIMSLWDISHVTVTDKDDPETVRKIQELGYPIIRTAKITSPVYLEWLRLYHTPGEILPHIQWGGHIESTPEGDGGAGYRAWQLYALTLT